MMVVFPFNSLVMESNDNNDFSFLDIFTGIHLCHNLYSIYDIHITMIVVTNLNFSWEINKETSHFSPKARILQKEKKNTERRKRKTTDLPQKLMPEKLQADSSQTEIYY